MAALVYGRARSVPGERKRKIAGLTNGGYG